MKEHALSVAMCTYNGARFLPEQLGSIAGQTRLPGELVICDDGSGDGTVEIVRNFARHAAFPVRLQINEKNLGSTKNFERAIGLCQGEIIVLADQDDVWLPQKLSCMAKILECSEDIGAVFSDAELIDEDSRPLGTTLWSTFLFNSRELEKFRGGQGLKVLLKHSLVTGATMAFRSKFRDLVLPIPSNHVQDFWIALLIASVSQLSPIRAPLMRYRKHAAQQIGPRYTGSLRQTMDVSKTVARDYYLGEAERFKDVLEHLCDCCVKFPFHSNALGLIQQKISHRKARGSFPKSRLLRLPSLFWEMVTFRYWRYSNGLGSVAKDLLI